MKKSRAICALLVALTGATTTSALAGFVNEAGTGELRVIGKLTNEDKAAGMGRNVTIRDAVRQIAPADYSLRVAPGADAMADKRVSWRGGRPWSEVLGDVVGTAPDLSAEVDVAAKLITLAANPGVRVEQVEKASAGLSTWRIRNGDKISETLATWGREAGWQGVFWEAPELIAEIEVALSGRFEDAVTQTIEALSRNGVQLRVLFYGGNKVVRIVEAK